MMLTILQQIQTLTSVYDGYYYLAYLALALCRLKSLPILLATLSCSIVFELTLKLPAEIYYVVSSIIFSYVTLYYYKYNLRCWIACALMSFIDFFMGMERVLNAIAGEWLYNALYDNYEIIVTSVHVLAILLLIHWRRSFRFVANIFNSTSTGNVGFK